jgi:ribosome production factor 2
MVELYLDPESFRMLKQFKNKKCAVGLKPMLLFAGTPFESPVSNEYTLLKSFFTDFFKGEPADKVDVEGLQYIVSISARDTVDGEEAKPAVHLRVYLIKTKRSGQKLPRVEVEEMGPRMDFRVGRV